MQRCMVIRLTGLRTGQGCLPFGCVCERFAFRPDRLKGWCYTMCSMGECTRKDVVSGTTCAWCALDGLSGFVTYGKSRMGVLEFRTLGLPLVAPSNPLRL